MIEPQTLIKEEDNRSCSIARKGRGAVHFAAEDDYFGGDSIPLATSSQTGINTLTIKNIPH